MKHQGANGNNGNILSFVFISTLFSQRSFPVDDLKIEIRHLFRYRQAGRHFF